MFSLVVMSNEFSLVVMSNESAQGCPRDERGGRLWGLELSSRGEPSPPRVWEVPSEKTEKTEKMPPPSSFGDMKDGMAVCVCVCVCGVW